MERLKSISLGKLVAVFTLIVVGGVVATSGQHMFSSGPLSTHNRRNVARGGVRSHADIASDCAACHAPFWSGETMAERCLNCHDDIRSDIAKKSRMHGQLVQGSDCTKCHTEHQGHHAAITNFANFDHDCTAFKLDGKHETLECKACHTNGLNRGTPAACVSCHVKADVHKGRFGANCASCHATSSWKSHTISAKDFDHDVTSFKLTGKHAIADCKSCHKNDVYKGTSHSCVDCHHRDDRHKGKLGRNCAQCHSTFAWTIRAFDVIAFDHSETGYELTGKHATVDCRMCHKNDQFKGTSRKCSDCHAEPKSHIGKYGKDCTVCHTTSTWDGFNFHHSFPINHANAMKKGQSCNICHPNLDLLTTYTCYGCHHHSPDKEAKRHARQKLKVPLAQCATCHPTGRRIKLAANNEAPRDGACPIGNGSLTSAPLGCPAPEAGLTLSVDMVNPLAAVAARGVPAKPARPVAPIHDLPTLPDLRPHAALDLIQLLYPDRKTNIPR